MDDIVEVIRNIEGGGYDKYLIALANTVKNRQEAMQASGQYRFVFGDTVVFNSNTKPAYMQGIEATIVGRRTKKWIVEIDRNIGRFRKGAKIIAPGSILSPRVEDYKPKPIFPPISELLKDIDLGPEEPPEEDDRSGWEEE